jgi:Tfp pilus assembly protein PilF
MPMKAWRNLLPVALILAALGGCAADAVKGVFQSKGARELSTGIDKYEDGKYGEATTALQRALDLGLSNSDQVKAHKYLAFVHCTSGREKQCRDEFGRALDINPALELEPAESGHPIWGPEFRSAKARR